MIFPLKKNILVLQYDRVFTILPLQALNKQDSLPNSNYKLRIVADNPVIEKLNNNLYRETLHIVSHFKQTMEDKNYPIEFPHQ